MTTRCRICGREWIVSIRRDGKDGNFERSSI